MLDGDSPLLVRPRPQLDFLRWVWRFALACRRGAHTRGDGGDTRARAATARRTSTCCAARAVEFEMHADGLLYLVLDAKKLEEWIVAYDELAALGFDGELTAMDRAASPRWSRASATA